MKKLILIVSLFVAANVCFSQTKTDIVFMMEGECQVVLNHIRRQVQNDSLSVQYFLNNYKIIDNRIPGVRNEDYKDVIRLLNLPENLDLFCVRKSEYNKNALIQDEKDSATSK